MDGDAERGAGRGRSEGRERSKERGHREKERDVNDITERCPGRSKGSRSLCRTKDVPRPARCGVRLGRVCTGRRGLLADLGAVPGVWKGGFGCVSSGGTRDAEIRCSHCPTRWPLSEATPPVRELPPSTSHPNLPSETLRFSEEEQHKSARAQSCPWTGRASLSFQAIHGEIYCGTSVGLTTVLEPSQMRQYL